MPAGQVTQTNNTQDVEAGGGEQFVGSQCRAG